MANGASRSVSLVKDEHGGEKMTKRFLLGLLVAAPVLASACVRPVDSDAIAARRWMPVIKAGEQQAPLKQNMVIGSVHAYLVPQQAGATVRAVRQGMMAPLEILSDEAVARASRRFRFTGDDAPASAPPGRKWIYVYATSFGKSELRFSDSSGWGQLVELGMVYPQAQPHGEPAQLAPDAGGDPVSFDVDADRNTLWLSVPGLVKDRWTMVEGADTSFELMRLEQLPVPYGDPPLVGLFLVGSRSLKSGIIRMEGGDVPRKVFKFKVRALPSRSC